MKQGLEMKFSNSRNEMSRAQSHINNNKVSTEVINGAQIKLERKEAAAFLIPKPLERWAISERSRHRQLLTIATVPRFGQVKRPNFK